MEVQKLSDREKPGKKDEIMLNLDMANLDMNEIEGLLAKTGASTKDGDEDEGSEQRKTWKTYVRMVLPHVGLLVASIVYGVCGSFIFYNVEHPHELEAKANSLEQIKRIRAELVSDMWTGAKNGLTKEQWKENAEATLVKLTEAYYRASERSYVTYRDVINSQKPVEQREEISIWTQSSALFFAISTMATIGYGNVVPSSHSGRIICIFFCLIGTPIAVITIGDMGKFFSEFVLRVYWKYRKLKEIVARRMQTHWRKSTLPSFVTNSTMTTTTANSEAALEAQETASFDMNADEFLLDRRHVPVAMVFGIMVLYIALGASFFCWMEGWAYVESFYFCFISLTTIGFGDIVPKKHEYLLLMLIYIGIGLAITTMSIDLVGIHYIDKIHYFGRKFRGTDLLHYLRRKRQIERRIALAQQSKIIDWWLDQEDKSIGPANGSVGSVPSSIRVPPYVPSFPSWRKSQIEESETEVEDSDDGRENGKLPSPLITLTPSPSIPPRLLQRPASISSSRSEYISELSPTSSTCERERQNERRQFSVDSWNESGPDVPPDLTSLDTSPSVYERERIYRSGLPSPSSWAECGRDLIEVCSLSTEPSVYERERLYDQSRRRPSRNSWKESGPELPIVCSVSPSPSFYERERMGQVIEQTPDIDFVIDWVPAVTLSTSVLEEPSFDYQRLGVEARSQRRSGSCPTIERFEPKKPLEPKVIEPTELLPSPVQLFEEYATERSKFQLHLAQTELLEKPEFHQAVELRTNDSDDEDEQNPPSLLSPLDIDIEFGSTILSTPTSSPSESVLDFADAEMLEFPCDSGMSTETEAEFDLRAKDDSVITYHQNIPVYSVESKAVESEQAISNALRCPEKCISAKPPQLVTENYCFVLDGEKVKISDITSGDNIWWRQTGHPTKYYYSDDLKTFHKVQILMIKGKVINARLIKPLHNKILPLARQFHSSHSSLDSKMSFGHLSLPEAHEVSKPEKCGIERDVPLAKVYKVTRFYSFWRTCTGFHRIVTVIAPVGGVTSEHRRRIFVQYLWRNASELDKLRVAMEFNPKTQKLMKYAQIDPTKRRRMFHF